MGHEEADRLQEQQGQRLQATLTLPAGYEPGKKYPMLVYFYELMSDTHHNFSLPVYDDRPHMSTYASNGYLVLQPDVVYEIGKPGTSALDCVTSAVKKVIELGYADPAHIGLQGHSWGGYQSSFIVTQTDIFAAVVTGAPPTDLTSFVGTLYRSTRHAPAGHHRGRARCAWARARRRGRRTSCTRASRRCTTRRRSRRRS